MRGRVRRPRPAAGRRRDRRAAAARGGCRGGGEDARLGTGGAPAGSGADGRRLEQRRGGAGRGGCVGARHRQRLRREHPAARRVGGCVRAAADGGARADHRALPPGRAAQRRPHPDRPARGVRRRPGAGALGDGRARTGGTRASRRCRCRRRAGVDAARAAGGRGLRGGGVAAVAAGGGGGRTGGGRARGGRRAAGAVGVRLARARVGGHPALLGARGLPGRSHRRGRHAGAGGLGPFRLPLPGGDGGHRRGGRARHRRSRAAARRRSAARRSRSCCPRAWSACPRWPSRRATTTPACRSASSSSAGRGRSTCCSPPLGPSNAPDRADRPRRFPDGKRAAAACRARIATRRVRDRDSPCWM